MLWWDKASQLDDLLHFSINGCGALCCTVICFLCRQRWNHATVVHFHHFPYSTSIMQRGAGHLFIQHSFSSLCLPQWKPFFLHLSHLYSNRSLDCSQIRFASADKTTRLHHTHSALSVIPHSFFPSYPFVFFGYIRKKKKKTLLKRFHLPVLYLQHMWNFLPEGNFSDLSSYPMREFLISSLNKNSKMSHLEM